MTDELKPCPICASTAVILRDGHVWKYVECMECDYKSKAVTDIAVAVQVYNYRPIENDLQVALTEAININTEMQREIEKLRLALMKIVASTQQSYDYDRIGSGEFDDKYPEWRELDPNMFMNAAIQANETARAALGKK